MEEAGNAYTNLIERLHGKRPPGRLGENGTTVSTK
jgi:hypothetical protein